LFVDVTARGISVAPRPSEECFAMSRKLILAVLLISCGDDDPDSIDDIDDVDPFEEDVTVVRGTQLYATPGYEPIAGTASVTFDIGAGQFVATATIMNDLPDAIRPWHVHFGNCASGGAIVGDGYDPLVINAGGVGHATNTIAFELDPTAAYHVNVHDSPATLTTIIACGDLSGGSTPPPPGDGGSDNDEDTPY
jgi:hypothetical protein